MPFCRCLVTWDSLFSPLNTSYVLYHEKEKARTETIYLYQRRKLIWKKEQHGSWKESLINWHLVSSLANQCKEIIDYATIELERECSRRRNNVIKAGQQVANWNNIGMSFSADTCVYHAVSISPLWRDMLQPKICSWSSTQELLRNIYLRCCCS